MPIQTVLIVEDNQGFAETLAEVLKSRGFTTQWVDTPDSARTLAELNRFDLMIIDHGLEGQSGVELAKELAHQDRLHRVIFLTGRISMSSDDIPGNLSGRAAVLHKPVEMDHLLETIHALSK